MTKSKLLLPLLFIIASNLSSWGQQKDILRSTLQTPKEYYLQVKQLGEFIDRFNYKSDWRGNLITDEFAKVVPRPSYIFYLINGIDSRLTSQTDSSYRALCSDFIADICNPIAPQSVSLYSGQVKASVRVMFTYNGKLQSANLEMIPEVLPDRSAKWVISSVETDCLATNADSLVKHFIAPNSHETSFINLNKLNSTSDPLYLFTKPAATTSRFISEVAKKRIVIQNTEKVTYRISFLGWEITVDEFNRITNNSGWLISDIKKR